MVTANLNLSNAIYWVIVIVGGILFCLTDNTQTSQSHHSVLGKVMVALSCIVSGANGIYRTITQQENISLVNMLLIVELVLLVIALALDIHATGLIAIPYILSRYIIGCLIMCTPISLIVTSKALGGLVGGVVVIIIFYLICSSGPSTNQSENMGTIVLNGEAYQVLRQDSFFGGNVIEYRDSDGSTKTLSQDGPGSSLYKTENGEIVRLEANGYLNKQ